MWYALNQKPLYICFPIERIYESIFHLSQWPTGRFCAFRFPNSVLKVLDFCWKSTIIICTDTLNEHLHLGAHTFQEIQQGSRCLLSAITGHDGGARQSHSTECGKISSDNQLEDSTFAWSNLSPNSAAVQVSFYPVLPSQPPSWIVLWRISLPSPFFLKNSLALLIPSWGLSFKEPKQSNKIKMLSVLMLSLPFGSFYMLMLHSMTMWKLYRKCNYS